MTVLEGYLGSDNFDLVRRRDLDRDAETSTITDMDLIEVEGGGKVLEE